MASAAWRPSGVVTLTTDFGLTDPYAGILHGVLLRQDARLAVVDLTHGIPPQDVRSAAFHLAHSWRWFPAGTVHVAVVDPGVGSPRRILVARDRDHAFLAPDNGLLGPILGEAAAVRALDVERFALPNRSRTFHGRDVFAPAAAALAGGLDPAEAGGPAGPIERLSFPGPSMGERGGVEGQVLVVDRFGNLITNVPDALLEGPPSAWRARAGGQLAPAAGTYAEVAPGALVALVDSFGYWELAVRDGSAAALLGLGPGAPVRFEPSRARR
jgi:S-adenosylmethionine hydrolase